MNQEDLVAKANIEEYLLEQAGKQKQASENIAEKIPA